MSLKYTDTFRKPDVQGLSGIANTFFFSALSVPQLCKFTPDQRCSVVRKHCGSVSETLIEVSKLLFYQIMKLFNVREHGLNYFHFRVVQTDFALNLLCSLGKNTASHLCLGTAWLSE